MHVALGTELPAQPGALDLLPEPASRLVLGRRARIARASPRCVASLPRRCRAAARPGARRRAPAGSPMTCTRLLRPSLTVALDFNPLFLLAAARILAGPPLELYEFPIAPRSHRGPRACCACHEAPEPPAPDFMLVLADARAPPFPPGQLRPGADALVHRRRRRAGRRGSLPRVNALLAPGGLWVNHGSLAFADAAPAEALEPRGTRRRRCRRPVSPAQRRARRASPISRHRRAVMRASSP